MYHVKAFLETLSLFYYYLISIFFVKYAHVCVHALNIFRYRKIF